MSCLHALVAIAAALNNADADGRILVDAHAQSIKFVLLNGAAHFVKVTSSLPRQAGDCATSCGPSLGLPSLVREHVLSLHTRRAAVLANGVNACSVSSSNRGASAGRVHIPHAPPSLARRA